MRFHPSLPRGFSKKQLRLARKRWSMRGKVDIHHVVPRQLKRHPHLKRFKYDVEEDYNLMFCATRIGSFSLNLKPSRPIHDLNHSGYNFFVSQQLDAVTDLSSFLLLLATLYGICRGRVTCARCQTRHRPMPMWDATGKCKEGLSVRCE